MNIYNKIAEYSNKGMPFVICTVVDKKGDIKGYITNKELETSLVKS